MRAEDIVVLDGLKDMAAQARDIGLCALPFVTLYDYVERLIHERDEAVQALAGKECDNGKS